MSALPVGTFISPGRSLFKSRVEPMRISSIVGLSSINGEPYSGSTPVPPTPVGPTIYSGTISLATNGQTITYPAPFTSNVSVVVQGTSNAAGVNGFFTVFTGGSLSDFRVFYSGELIYGPIELFYIAVGT